MNEEDKEQWSQIRTVVRHTISRNNFKLLCKLHADYFKHTYYEPCTCSKKTIKRWVQDIDSLYLNEIQKKI
jgi:hypothetical protein